MLDEVKRDVSETMLDRVSKAVEAVEIVCDETDVDMMDAAEVDIAEFFSVVVNDTDTLDANLSLAKAAKLCLLDALVERLGELSDVLETDVTSALGCEMLVWEDDERVEVAALVSELGTFDACELTRDSLFGNGSRVCDALDDASSCEARDRLLRRYIRLGNRRVMCLS